ncbi:hypothetical protein [Shewanella oncorhynchi]|uniref:hypothetical protein n=1 Tax=Shewanella oncorhynchi TaxID=2726434 RepID=UPI001FFDD660|nr:hypothetical protein [Shewanella oncorhynchi]
MTKMEKLAPVAQIACLSPVESEFEQLLNLSKRQASSHDASTFDGEKEAIETHEAEHEESFIWGHVVPVAAHAPLRQHIFSASKTVRIHSSDAVGRRPKSEIHEPLSNEANLQQPRHRGISAILVATHDQSQLKVNNIGESAVNALVSPSITPVGKPLDIQTAAGTDKTALPIMTTPSQPIATALKSTQSSPIDSSPISQPAAGMGRESVVTPQVSTMSVGKSLNSAQSVVNSEQVGRSLTTPPQPTATVPKSTQSLPIKSPLISQPAAVMGRESVVNPQVSTMPLGKSLNSTRPVVSLEQAGRSMTTPPQPIATVPNSTQPSPINSSPISQLAAGVGRELIVNPQASTMSVGKSLNSAQLVVNSELVGRSLMTPPQPIATAYQPAQSSLIKSPLISQPNAVMRRESAVHAQVSTTPVGKSLNAAQPVVNSELAGRSPTTPPQFIATASQPAQSSAIKSPLISQHATVMGSESAVNAQVSITPVGKSLNSAQSVVNSEQVGRSLTTPPQPIATVSQPTQSLPIKSLLISQPAAVMGRESVVNPQVPTMPVGKSLNSVQPVVNSEQAGRSLTTPPQPIAVVPQSTQSSAIKSPLISQPPTVMGRESGANLQKQSELKVAHSPLSILARVQRESNANKGLSAEEKKEDPIIKASVVFNSNLEVKEGGQQVNMVSIEEKSSVLATRMELPSLGSKHAAIGTVNTAMTVQPVLSSLMLHYQIAPEYFTQYVQLNTYRVFFRNKYYVFQFEDNKVTNFLEDYYDRH